MNNQNEQFSIRKRLKSFIYAFRGLSLLIRKEHNARIHVFASFCVVIAGYFFQISYSEWIAIVIAIGFVFSAEALNSAIETLADLVSPNYNEFIKQTKDLAAGGVLLAAITALIIGLIIFLPKLLLLFK